MKNPYRLSNKIYRVRRGSVGVVVLLIEKTKQKKKTLELPLIASLFSSETKTYIYLGTFV